MHDSSATLAAAPPDGLRERLRALLQRRHTGSDSAARAQAAWEHGRFVARAQALFYARLMFLTLGLLILAVPAWSRYFGLSGRFAYTGYLAMLLYGVANFRLVQQPRVGRWLTYATLCLDLLALVALIGRPQAGGGLQSPLLATQLLLTTLFAILFPRPLALAPPLAVLPITLLLQREVTAVELLTLLWYGALDAIVVYVIVFLNEREAAAHREVVALQAEVRALAVVEERNRLAREIHDGLGASLSTLIIQSELLLGLAREEPLRHEVRELKTGAEEAIDELRRNLQLMREDFELVQGIEDYVKRFRERTQLDVGFARSGTAQRLPPKVQLAVFRILQECLTNAAKHGGSASVRVRVALTFSPGRVDLQVEDDGQGFEPGRTPHGHYGLLHMHERALQIGGALSVESAPRAGTRVRLSLPSP